MTTKRFLNLITPLLLTGILPLLIVTESRARQKNNPVAERKAAIVDQDVRFTVLTPGLIRMEWDSLAKFEDNASFVVVNRNLPVAPFTHGTNDGWIEIRTDKLEIRYKRGSGKFTPENLQISFVNGEKRKTWTPGMPNDGNLKGTYRTLDGCDGNMRMNRDGGREPISLEDGLISTDGWFLWDDSKDFLFDHSDWNWVQTRPRGDRQDWYFFGYGHDYKQALYDFTQVAGKIPLPPRFAFGYWWSRYWNYSDREFRDLVGDLDRNQIPHDVLVVDMDWHITQIPNAGSTRDEFGQRLGWTGYTWNKNLFPDPAEFLKWTNDKHLKTTLNLHPASGIAPFEEKYDEFAKAINFDTAKRHNIPFECADKTFMETLFKIVLHPMQTEGVDFWWLDWQQWPESKKVPGLSNTWWLNYCFFTDMERNGDQRPLLYHRWGGMGNHRYEIGFSGDTKISWKSLDYQPYFTSTASNVGYGYWSHDIGGHYIMGNDTVDAHNPELYTRWLQFAAFSPIFRTHSTKDSRIHKEMWIYPPHYREPMYDAVDIRYSLVPYIYTMARKTYDTGISLCHPLYYEYPDKQEAYDFKNEYFFGDNMIVLPVTAPDTDDFATVKVWLPEGEWYEWFTGARLKGGRVYERSFLIDEIPVYVKAGAIIPMYPKVKNLQQSIDELIVRVYPGGDFEGKLYKDDGDNRDYLNNGFAFTKLTSERQSNGSRTLTIFPREGSFKGMSESRSYEIQLFGALAPAAIDVNGRNIPYSYERADYTWNYSGKDLTTHIYIPKTNCGQRVRIHVTYSPEAARNADVVNGVIDKMNRLRYCTSLIKASGPVPDSLSGTDITDMRLEYFPQNNISDLISFNRLYDTLPQTIQSLQINDATKARAIHYLTEIPGR